MCRRKVTESGTWGSRVGSPLNNPYGAPHVYEASVSHVCLVNSIGRTFVTDDTSRKANRKGHGSVLPCCDRNVCKGPWGTESHPHTSKAQVSATNTNLGMSLSFPYSLEPRRGEENTEKVLRPPPLLRTAGLPAALRDADALTVQHPLCLGSWHTLVQGPSRRTHCVQPGFVFLLHTYKPLDYAKGLCHRGCKLLPGPHLLPAPPGAPTHAWFPASKATHLLPQERWPALHRAGRKAAPTSRHSLRLTQRSPPTHARHRRDTSPCMSGMQLQASTRGAVSICSQLALSESSLLPLSGHNKASSVDSTKASCVDGSTWPFSGHTTLQLL